MYSVCAHVLMRSVHIVLVAISVVCAFACFSLAHFVFCQVQDVAVNNPSNRPLLVQALMLAVYPNPDSVLRLLKGQ